MLRRTSGGIRMETGASRRRRRPDKPEKERTQSVMRSTNWFMDARSRNLCNVTLHITIHQ